MSSCCRSPTIASLAEFLFSFLPKKFNQLELKRIVERGKASAQYLKESRKPVPGFWGRGWTLKWQGLFTYFPGNLLYQFGTIKLDQTCVNLQ